MTKPSDCQCYECRTTVSMWCKHFLEMCDEGHNCDECIYPVNDCTDQVMKS